MTQAQDIKHIDIKEFRELGFLQEANRLFFHPLGLALEVTIDDETGDEYLSGVWDYRDDPEGMIFSWSDWPDPKEASKEATQKQRRVTQEVNKHREAREKLFKELYPQWVVSDSAIEPIPWYDGNERE